MRVLVIALLLAVSANALVAQKKNVVVGDQAAINYEQGKALYDKSKYNEAIPYFEKALEADNTNQDSWYYQSRFLRFPVKYPHPDTQSQEGPGRYRHYL